jgi:hypothetical protein
LIDVPWSPPMNEWMLTFIIALAGAESIGLPSAPGLQPPYNGPTHLSSLLPFA